MLNYYKLKAEQFEPNELWDDSYYPSDPDLMTDQLLIGRHKSDKKLSNFLSKKLFDRYDREDYLEAQGHATRYAEGYDEKEDPISLTDEEKEAYYPQTFENRHPRTGEYIRTSRRYPDGYYAERTHAKKIELQRTLRPHRLAIQINNARRRYLRGEGRPIRRGRPILPHKISRNYYRGRIIKLHKTQFPYGLSFEEMMRRDRRGLEPRGVYIDYFIRMKAKREWEKKKKKKKKKKITLMIL